MAYMYERVKEEMLTESRERQAQAKQALADALEQASEANKALQRQRTATAEMELANRKLNNNVIHK